MTNSKKKAPAATGAINTEASKKRNESVTTTIPDTTDRFNTTFDISTTNARIYIETDDDYCEKYGITNEQRVFDTTGMIRVDTGSEVLFLGAAEALSVAAALQAVAVHLMEEKAAA